MTADDTSLSSDRVLERLTCLHPKLIDLSLDRIKRLLDALGNPEQRLPTTFHIAGTNGKGSVSAYLRFILEAEGYAVHSYTSPHLVHFHERIRLAGNPSSAAIEETALVELLEECERANAGQPITFFEITTAAALLAFSRHPADALILEVGMGGRFDTTNVIQHPAACIITPVDLDHQAFLGDTLSLIAAEKAGILKPHATAIIGPQQDEARETIEQIATSTRIPLIIHGQDFSAYADAGAMIYQDEKGLLDLPLPRLRGRHQIDNAATAICALRQVKELPISDASIAEGLRNVEWPARLQRLRQGPLFSALPDDAEVWLDGGHNPAAGRVVADAMDELSKRAPKEMKRPLVMICGMLDTKDTTGYFRAFQSLIPKVLTIAIPEAEASLSAETLSRSAKNGGLNSTAMNSLDEALAYITRTSGPTSPRVLICGSLYLAGYILRNHK